ncbi:MAG TPA: hypothetical protein VK486_16415, partial [Thermoleophilaceae bacterium]|nr:hypothetical protein [Thermoleophilaceae bacterium]
MIVVLAVVGAVLVLTSGSSPRENRASEQAGERERESPAEEKLEKEGLGPEDAYLFQRFVGQLKARSALSSAAFDKAGSQASAVRANTSRTKPAVQGAAWSFEGPSNVGGRIVDLAVDPNHRDTVYVVAATGGVWRTSDQ